MTPDTLLNIRRVCERVSLSASRVYQLQRAGQFPRPTRIGQLNLWSSNEIGLWVQEQLDKRTQRQSERLAARTA